MIVVAIALAAALAVLAYYQYQLIYVVRWIVTNVTVVSTNRKDEEILRQVARRLGIKLPEQGD